MDNFEKNTQALSCIVCDSPLVNIDGPNQPDNGLAFSTSGHYGTTFFDPMDDTSIEINVCDACLVKAAAKKQILIYEMGHVQARTKLYVHRNREE
jgi:hypothetical protein